MIRRPADTHFYAYSSRGRFRLQADVIANRIAKTLLVLQVSLRWLNRNNPNRASDVCCGEDGAEEGRKQRWQGEVTTTTLAAGATTVTATYNGDSNIAKSSAAVTQTVQQ